ncbi:MAG TPA: Cof-type HAD-IIB family hydrolase [Bacillales bacterium]|nr:Cof-type HAD-IIB family hydrolase [Bacillales bacterium]
MTNPHLIALDLDGTLLNDEKIVTEKTMKTLAEAKKKGHKVVFATGRPFRASQAYYELLELDTPAVNFNGAFVHNPTDPEWGVFHQPLPLKTATTVIQTCEAFEAQNIIVEVVDDVYLKYHDEFFIDAFSEGGPRFHTGDLHELLKEDPTSIVIYPKDGNADELRALLDRSHAEVIEQRSWGAPFNIVEIVKGGVNKAVGLSRVAESFGIPQERVIAFGDEDNDLEMIEYAGHGVAMANAIDELKDIANAITKSNNDDGIAEYLQKVI